MGTGVQRIDRIMFFGLWNILRYKPNFYQILLNRSS